MNRRIITVIILLVLLVVIGTYFIYTINEKSPERIYAINKKAVVFISAYDYSGNLVKIGSGFIVDKNGIIATNYHVINDAGNIAIKTLDDRVLAVEGVKYFNVDKDLALIKIRKSKEYELTVVRIGDAEKIAVGEKVYAIGNPKGLESTFSEGNVSGVRQWGKDTNVIQITAPLSPGSSGGPVLDEYGRAIGISTFIVTEGQNLNFVVPVNYIKNEISKPEMAYSLISNPVKWDLFSSEMRSDQYIEDWSESFMDANSVITISDNLKGVWIRRSSRYGEQKKPYPSYYFWRHEPNSTSPPDFYYLYCDCLNQTISTILLAFNFDKNGTTNSMKEPQNWKSLREKVVSEMNERKAKLQKINNELTEAPNSSKSATLRDYQSEMIDTYEEREAIEQKMSSALVSKICK